MLANQSPSTSNMAIVTPSTTQSTTKTSPTFKQFGGELVEYTKAGNISRMRSHRGNKPAIPQTHLCSICPAKFTRITHLHRHLRTHTNERLHECERCHTQFTRSDLLTRHKRSCGDPSSASRTRRKSCQQCADGKTKCDQQLPCSRCKVRGRECTYVRAPVSKTRKQSPSNVGQSPASSSEETDRCNSSPGMSVSPSAPQIGLADLPSPMFDLTENPLMGLTQSLSAPQLFELPSFTQYRNFDEPSVLSSYAASTSGLSDKFDAFPVETQAPTSFAQDAIEVNHQLNALFSNELFDRFFRDASRGSGRSSPQAYTDGSASVTADDMLIGGGAQFPFPTEVMEMQPFMAEMPPSEFDMFGLPSSFVDSLTSNPLNMHFPIYPDPTLEPSVMPYPSEFQHYIHLFYTMFLTQMPVMHLATFTIDHKPQILLSTMQACGALYVRTQAAAKFIDDTLVSARDQLVAEFARNPTKSEDQVHLILAVALIQTIGLFHQRPEQRAHSSIYHGMLVMMIRQSGLINKLNNWVPPSVDTLSETDWQDWAFHETAKRALLLSYLHDCCHCIYFTLRPTFLWDEVTIPLPCEDAMWKANSWLEWKMTLQMPSPYGTPHERFRPPGLQLSLQYMADSTSQYQTQKPLILTPFSHFVTSHAILRKVFEDCVEKRHLDSHQETTPSIQLMLHNWLQSWLHSPETPHYAEQEPIFLHDALPFYWIAQVMLLAYQENLPPFAASDLLGADALGEAKFRLVKEWLRQIRMFLCRGEQGPTLFWDELTKIRMKTEYRTGGLDTMSSAVGNGSDNSQGGLLGFFAEA